MTDGWEGLEPALADLPKAEDIDIVYGRVFKSEEGQKVLHHLRTLTIEQPTWNPGEDS